MAVKIKVLPQGHILKSPTYTYRIESVLGCGGFGITYLASTYIKVDNVSLKVRFAIKEHFLSSDCERDVNTSQVVYSNPAKERVENSRKDFLAEAKRLKKVGVNHPNIVKVNEVFEANNTAYYVMEYLDGESLRSWIRKNGAMDEEMIFSTLNPIIEAVQHLHKNRMTHLDIKPDNIMLTHDENGDIRPVLIDFGLSKHYDKGGKPTSTINTLGCSDGYAPMEQYAGITIFSPSADIYALGATMYFCAIAKDPKKSTELDEGELSSVVEPISKTISIVIGKACSLNRNMRSIQPYCKLKDCDVEPTNSTKQIHTISEDTLSTEKIDAPNSQNNVTYQLITFRKTSRKTICCIVAIIIICWTIFGASYGYIKGLYEIFSKLGAIASYVLSIYGLIETKAFVKSGFIKYVWSTAVALALYPRSTDGYEEFFVGFAVFAVTMLCYELVVNKLPQITQIGFVLSMLLSALLYMC